MTKKCLCGHKKSEHSYSETEHCKKCECMYFEEIKIKLL